MPFLYLTCVSVDDFLQSKNCIDMELSLFTFLGTALQSKV